jgi:hypothetical protein
MIITDGKCLLIQELLIALIHDRFLLMRVVPMPQGPEAPLIIHGLCHSTGI